MQQHIALIRRQDVKGFVQRKPVWLVRPLGLDTVRKQASAIEVETRGFYEPRRVPRTPASANFWMTSHRKNAHTRIAPRN